MKLCLDLTPTEYDQVMSAIGQMTAGNAYDLREMMLCGMTRQQAKALVSAETKLREAKSAK